MDNSFALGSSIAIEDPITLLCCDSETHGKVDGRRVESLIVLESESLRRRFIGALLLRRDRVGFSCIGDDVSPQLLPDGGECGALVFDEDCGWKTRSLARAAMSSAPICQCIASTARQGSPSSEATISHISALNLCGRAKVSGVVIKLNSNEDSLNVFLPVVQSCELVLLLLIPLWTFLTVILVAQPATDCATTRNLFRNVVPFYFPATELDRDSILFGCPFPMVLLVRR